MSKLFLGVATSCSLIFPLAAVAQHSHDHHVHGEGNLVIVTETNPVTVEFSSDLWNLVGFESAPKTEAQENLLSDAQTTLESADNILEFNRQAECILQSAESNFSTLFKEHDHDHDHEHDHSHDHENHDEHDEHQDHGLAGGHDDGHVKAEVTYTYQCARLDRLNSLSTSLLEEFGNLEKVEAVAFTPAGQLWHQFRKSASKMDLK
ncbi:MAG: DUF2796 domain-containing protein [Aquisalinus sp.]|nr:DUF2796 domain-containing protein [Aquisalinus sp.]